MEEQNVMRNGVRNAYYRMPNGIRTLCSRLVGDAQNFIDGSLEKAS